MKVSFTTKEYARLLELAFIGQAVVDGRMETGEKRSARYDELLQKIFSLAAAHGCAELVEDDGEALNPSGALETGPAAAILDKFVDEAFWSELAERLALRDLQAAQGVRPAVQRELTEAEISQLDELSEGYWKEFEKYGVDHVQVLRGGHG